MDNIYDFSILRELRKREKMNIAELSEASGVSVAVISKLERNQVVPAIETVYRLGRVFSMKTSEIMALAESRSAQKTKQSTRKTGQFSIKEVKYGNIKCLYATAPGGATLSRPEVHRDDYELCWILSGKILFQLPKEKHILSSGDALQFDALQEHSYKVLEDTKFIIIHLKKGKRF